MAPTLRTRPPRTAVSSSTAAKKPTTISSALKASKSTSGVRKTSTKPKTSPGSSKSSPKTPKTPTKASDNNTPASASLISSPTPKKLHESANRTIDPELTAIHTLSPQNTITHPAAEFTASRQTDVAASNALATACAHIIKVAPELKGLVKRHECKIYSEHGLREVVDPFESLASGIISQQVSGAAARSIKTKFIGLFHGELEVGRNFPTPAQTLAKDIATLRSAGLSERKAAYLHSLSTAFTSGTLNASRFATSENEELIKELTKIHGIGRWSAEMFLMFGLRRMDVFSTGDLGIQRGMAIWQGRNVAKLRTAKGKWKYMGEKEMEGLAERFRPWRSVFCWYMWRIGDTEVEAMGGAEGEAAKKGVKGRKKAVDEGDVPLETQA